MNVEIDLDRYDDQVAKDDCHMTDLKRTFKWLTGLMESMEQNQK